ncbi:MAG: iron-containing alcohol dehydrogenase family protein [Lachnospiraceae bacterium]
MLGINTPSFYISESGAINKIGETALRAVRQQSKKALVVWSKTAKEVTQEKIKASLAAAGIGYEEILFEGFPTYQRAEQYAACAAQEHADFFLAVGGGRVMDTTKIAATYANIPVITVPTIAATCACWAAVSIVYTDDGDCLEGFMNPKSAVAVIADTEILSKAPIRYIKAGVVDTMAKWYELQTDAASAEDFATQISLHSAKLSVTYLEENGKEVIDRIQQGIIDERTVKVMDAVIFLQGTVGSFVGRKAFAGFAHPFYNSSRRVFSTHQKLHAEVVAFGLIAQAVLLKKSPEEIQRMLRIFDRFEQVYTLEDLGLAENAAEKVNTIAKRLHDFPNTVTGKDTPVTILEHAIFEANNYTTAFKKDLPQEVKGQED